MIDFERANKALEYLVSTDSEVGRLKAYYEKMDAHKKVILATVFNSASGTNSERQYEALASKEYQDHLKVVEEAQSAFEKVRATRHTADLLIQMWRSVHSAQRKGNV